MLRRAEEMPKYEKWLSEHPPPGGNMRDPDWIATSLKACPYLVSFARLTMELHFLRDCQEFPAKHWLEVDPKVRSHIGKLVRERRRWGNDPKDLASQKLSISRLSDYLSSPFGRLTRAFAKYDPPEYSGEYAFSWWWSRSDRKLIEDFSRWLKENRPEGQAAIENSSASTSRRTNERDHLRTLSAYRLKRTFAGGYQEAQSHAFNVLGKPLYNDQAAWLKAERKAAKEIARFHEWAFARVFP